MKRFSRNRIQGISFHVQRSGVGRVRVKGSSLPPLPLVPAGGELLGGHALRCAALEGKPSDFTRADIRRLLEDFGRQELHTLVSDAIDAAVRWKQVSDAIDKLVASERGETRVYREDDVGALVEARATMRLWRHRIEMLEWIADAQHSLLTQGRMRAQGRKKEQ